MGNNPENQPERPEQTRIGHLNASVRHPRNFQESSEKRSGGILAIGAHGSVLWVPGVPEGHGRSRTTLMDLILCSKAPDSGILAVLLDTLVLWQ